MQDARCRMQDARCKTQRAARRFAGVVSGVDVWRIDLLQLHVRAAQGRYLFPALIPIGLAFTLGIDPVAEQNQSGLDQVDRSIQARSDAVAG